MELVILTCVVWLMPFIHNWLYKKFMFHGFTYRCHFSANEVYEGDEIELIEELINAKFLPMPWLKTDFTLSKWLDIAGTRSVVTDKVRFFSSFFMLKHHHSVTRSWKVKCMQRGVFPINRIIVVASDLFGNHIQSLAFPVNISITVLPNPTKLDSFSCTPISPFGYTPTRRGLITNPFETIGAREYTQHDSMNKIDWLATARTKKLMVRENTFFTNPNLIVILNMQSRQSERDAVLDEANVENAIRVCAGLFYQTMKDDIPVRFFANTSFNGTNYVSTMSGFGKEHTRDLLRVLAALPLRNTHEFSNFLTHISGDLKGSDIVVVTAYICDEMKEALAVHQNVTIITTGYFDGVPPNCELYDLYPFFNTTAPKN
ncbi:MAG: DUF58 domain-containing protein [Oscillospiraceae bacterium]